MYSNEQIQVQDVEGVELCGTLKNVVAIAAGSLFIVISFVPCPSNYS